MGLFSKRRNDGFDPELWTDADERAEGRGSGSWFEDLRGGASDLEELQTNAVVSFEEADAAWLRDDPGESARRRSSG